MILSPGDSVKTSTTLFDGEPSAGAVYGGPKDRGDGNGVFRYRLWRTWDPSKPDRALFVMLNPSTATEEFLDPTVRKCVGLAQAWGCGGIDVANLFAFRSTDPNGIYGGWSNTVGDNNDHHIRDLARNASIVVCAWGTHGKYLERGYRVAEMLSGVGTGLLWCLGANKDWSPRHPLYLPADVQKIVYANWNLQPRR